VAAATLTIRDAPGALQFDQPALTVQDGAGRVDIDVVRTGGLGPAVTVEFATLEPNDGTAVAGLDYTPTAQTLSFAALEARQTASVEILSNPQAQGNRTLRLVLRNATGGALLGTPTRATLVISHG
jgi:hypothetical protein